MNRDRVVIRIVDLYGILGLLLEAKSTHFHVASTPHGFVMRSLSNTPWCTQGSSEERYGFKDAKARAKRDVVLTSSYDKK